MAPPGRIPTSSRDKLGNALAIGTLVAISGFAGAAPSSQAVAPHWSVETAASGFAPSYLDLELDARGLEHLVVYDPNINAIKYRRRTSAGVWEDWNFPYQGDLPLLDFDPVDGRGYVLFKENVTGNLVLAWRDAQGAWTSTVAMAADLVQRTAFEMLAGTAHIGYVNGQSEILYRLFDPDGFSFTVQVEEYTGPVMAEVSLALRSDGLPRMTFNLDGELRYALTPDTFGWSTQLVDDSAASVGLFSSLALGPDDSPHISYEDDTNADLRYARRSFFQWVQSTVDGEASVAGELTSLALDPSTHRPRIAHRGDSACQVCFAAQQANGTWTRTVVADTPSSRRKLVLNAYGEARVAYATDGGASVAFQNLRIFVDGFESGDTTAWSAP